MEKIAIVTQNDEIIGYEPKLSVHKNGLLHRAFSILIFNDKGEMLIQKRAQSKYHSGGLWTNACCSHLIENCTMDEYIHNRLKHEMGFDCPLEYLSKFQYVAKFENGLTENEIDHIYIGKWNGNPELNLEEAEDFCWKSLDEIKQDIENQPEKFTYWFKEIIKRF